MVAAGSRTVDGLFIVVVPCCQGVSVLALLQLKVALIPLASMTAPDGAVCKAVKILAQMVLAVY